MISVEKGNLEMCKLLIDNEALPSINTPIYCTLRSLIADMHIIKYVCKYNIVHYHIYNIL
jgi:hypothetical protein